MKHVFDSAFNDVMLSPLTVQVTPGMGISWKYKSTIERVFFSSFIAEGIQTGDACAIMSDEEGADLFRKSIKELGINTTQAQRNKSLLIASIPGGVDSVKKPVDSIVDWLAKSEGRIRIINDLSACTPGNLSFQDYIRTEIQLHLAAFENPVAMICQFEAGKVQDEKLAKLADLHPHRIRGSKHIETGTVKSFREMLLQIVALQVEDTGTIWCERIRKLTHDLRTQMTPVLGWTKMLKDGISKDPLLIEGLEAIERNTFKQVELIEDFNQEPMVAALREPAKKAGHHPRTSITPRQGEDSRRVVLIAEDSQDTQEMLRIWLEYFGWEVLAAEDSATGLILAAEHSPTLIISDIGLPDEDGFEFINKVKKLPGLSDVPSIAVTGYVGETDSDRALNSGFNAYVSKPANMEDLLALIDQLIRK